MYGIIMFIIGGFVASIIFYPKKEKHIDTDYLAAMLSYQWHCGIYDAQTKKDMPTLPEAFIGQISFSPLAKASFKPAAEIVAKRIYK